MTTFGGGIGSSWIGFSDRDAMISDNLFTTETASNPGGFKAAEQGIGPGLFTSGQPVPMLFREVGGGIAGSLSGNDSWYHRIHVIPPVVPLGNVLSASTTPVGVWNAFLYKKTLQSITTSGDINGLTLDGGDGFALPYEMASLEERTFSVLATIDGASLFSVTYTFEFGSESRTLLVTGQRVFAWTFQPNWGAGIEERLEWKTDVLTSYNGTEQRLAIRSTPRRNMSYQFFIDNNNDRRKFEAVLHNWGGRQWMLPIWNEGQPLPTSVESGDLSLTLDRISGDWKATGTAIIVRGPFDFEALTVTSVVGNTIEFDDPIFSAWTTGAKIYPSVSAYLSDVQALERFTGATEGGRCDFMIVDPEETLPTYTPTLYKGHPIVEAPNWSQDITNDYSRKLAVVDYMVGKFRKTDEAGVPFQIISHHITADGKAAIDQLRAFLYYARGKQRVFWLPTFCEDLILHSEATSGAGYIDVEPGLIVQHLWGKPNRRDIRVELYSGAVYFRRLTNATDAGNYERLHLEAGIPTTLNSSTVSRISWANVARLDTDSVTMLWRHDDWVDCSFNWRTVRDDV